MGRLDRESEIHALLFKTHEYIDNALERLRVRLPAPCA
jgi:hypothetical protein